MSTSCRYATATMLKHDPLCFLDDSRTQQGCPQSVSDPPTCCIRNAGVLRYNRESDSDRMTLTILPGSPPLTEYPVKCEYCGETSRPSLDLTWPQEPETAPPFCCAQWQQLYEMLVKQRCLLERKVVSIPVSEMFASASKVLSFQLSSAPEKELYPTSTSESLQTEDMQVLIAFYDHSSSPCQFGICHHQVAAKTLQKYYSNGMKFLTVFTDGSAEVFYPSGLLAVIVVITEKNGRVCIIYDDSNTPAQPIRAVFQSDGRATCYHSNGNIWLSLNRSGGQCLDEMGARVRRWCWSNEGQTSTSLHPVFLSINKTVGVRVLGREQVFVSFLARGQQAKFCVGACSQEYSETDKPASAPAVLKEELFVMATRIRIQLAIQGLHQYLVTPSHPQLSKTIQASHLNADYKRLLEVSANVVMSDSERAFIQNCLQFPSNNVQ